MKRRISSLNLPVSFSLYNFVMMVSWSSSLRCKRFWGVLRNMKFSKFLCLERDCDAQPSNVFILWKYLLPLYHQHCHSQIASHGNFIKFGCQSVVLNVLTSQSRITPDAKFSGKWCMRKFWNRSACSTSLHRYKCEPLLIVFLNIIFNASRSVSDTLGSVYK